MFTAIDALEFPELHDESIPFMAFLKQLTKLMKAAGVRDFIDAGKRSCALLVYMPQLLWCTLRPVCRARNSYIEHTQAPFADRTSASRTPRGCGGT